MLPSLGVVGTTTFLDPSLEPLYGTASPRGFMVFLRVRPAGHGSHGAHAEHGAAADHSAPH